VKSRYVDARRLVPVLMRRSLGIFAAVACTACTRHLNTPYPQTSSAPAAPAPRVVLAGAPTLGRSAVSGEEAVSYLLTRALEIPVAGKSAAQLQDTFDEGRDGGRVHRALDILAPRGTPVLAADSGRVLRVKTNSLGGNTIYTTDPQGRIVYYYAHLDAYQRGLVEGLVIARGDTLGFVGTTGNAPKDTPHLHFQVMRMPPDGKYWDGEPINPYPLFLLQHGVVNDSLVEGTR
jgi:murein DD-endopeptidase MepM/ murein hydrolase activator NlpD